MSKQINSRRIQVLRDSVSRKIAAGEVIDRPASVIRELLDNAIDAGASEITVSIKSGGIDSIRVTDNGSGMAPEDLKLCYLPHATSKISEETDLLSIDTLGFRGEALASISTVSRTSITSRTKSSDAASTLFIVDGEIFDFSQTAGNTGTTVETRNIFHNFPARKRFLKNPGTEAKMCRKSFVEKALPHKDISFKYYSAGKLELYLPETDFDERVAAVFPKVFPKKMLSKLEATGVGFSVAIITPSIDLPRKDRSYIQIFANGRRIDEYSFVQAVEYGFSGYLPGGMFPAAIVILDIQPDLIDFNIHPAKKEARSSIFPDIHKTIVKTIGNFLSNRRITLLQPKDGEPKVQQFHFGNVKSVKAYDNFAKRFPPEPIQHERFQPLRTEPASNTAKSSHQDYAASPKVSYSQIVPFQYLGQFNRQYLIVEKDESLFIIDQHAAHEKILYNKLLDSPVKQELLVPIELSLESDEYKYLQSSVNSLDEAGFEFVIESDSCKITHIPASVSSLGTNFLKILTTPRGCSGELKPELFATIACRSAVKRGDYLDSLTATEIARQAFELEDARCPHGRPVWFLLSAHEIDTFVGRNI